MNTTEMKALITELDALAAKEGLSPREATDRLIQEPTTDQRRMEDIVFLLGNAIEDRVNARIQGRDARLWNDPRTPDEWWAELATVRAL